FPNSGDIYRLAHAHPYSYSDHKRHLAGLLENERTSRYLNHAILCKTLGGNDCDLLTVTDPHDTPITATGIVSGRYGLSGMVGRRGMNKRCVVISARVHPGETPASWMMRGMLDFLTGDSAEARLLRSLFVFKIVPMLNPDGVAFGNNRCSLAGVDLNRQWKRPSRALHPTVFWLKQYIRQEQAKKGVGMYIDLHGHR
ncbi:unnamed protein product, partial [Ectocarpus sp. 12 AP-2014]